MSKKTKSYQITKSIRQNILDGLYPINSTLPSERELAELFDVSRMPVRKALKDLGEEEVIVKNEANKWQVKGFHNISLLSESEPLEEVNLKRILIDSLKARQLVESEGARLAALNATDDDLQNLRLYLNNSIIELENFTDLDDPHYQDSDFKYHLAIAEASHNSLFPTYLKTIKEIIYMHQYLGMKYRRNIKGFEQYHTEIFDAISDKDEDMAYKLMYDHLGIVIQFITDGYQ